MQDDQKGARAKDMYHLYTGAEDCGMRKGRSIRGKNNVVVSPMESRRWLGGSGITADRAFSYINGIAGV